MLLHGPLHTSYKKAHSRTPQGWISGHQELTTDASGLPMVWIPFLICLSVCLFVCFFSAALEYYIHHFIYYVVHLSKKVSFRENAAQLCVCVCVCVCVSVFCLMYVLRMRLTPSLSPPLPRGMNGALCSPPQYDLFSSLNKSNARCAFVCFLVLEILSATNVQQRDRSELKISGDHTCAPMADVGFGARVDWLSSDVGLP